ncbi:SCO-spondin-like [Anopheles darlingi]|uniref:SCO-spondin-like n=1 Tax=Anopheles darlingi TaxID=43151 RepID=UPI0021004C34|nr:SCO-spondin-like [Anopheles darlingi]
MKVIILIVATLVVGALCSEQCVPGTTFKEDCNTCRCGENGLKACTRKMCTSVEAVVADEPYARNDNATSSSSTTESITSADEKEEVAEHTNGQVCTPNEIKMKDCNRCRCANNGIGWFCTRKACPPREKRSPEQEECSPGTTFESSDGCSECICTPDSKAVCTDKPCESRTKRDTGKPQSCTPGTSFKSADGCNDCFCTENGQPACTLKACLPNPAPYRRRRASPPKPYVQPAQDGCVPGSTFKDKDGCNDCFCSNDGRAACTLMACEPNPAPYRRRRSAPATGGCVPGQTKMADDGCNECHCTDDGRLACTRMACAPAAGEGSSSFFKREAPSPPKQECVPGSTFKDTDGCNECFCTDDGHAACTLLDCEPSSRRRRESPAQKCVPGSSFKDADGCNDCFCTNDGYAACTLKLCMPNAAGTSSSRQRRSPQELPACTPGETKLATDGCNQCTCTNTGKYACTRMACAPAAGEGSSAFFKREAPLLPTPTCTPGEVRMSDDGCNKCRCSSSGVLACTRKWCEPANEQHEKKSSVYKRDATTELPQSDVAPGTPGFTCTPRSSFKYQCNTCVCNDDGKNAGCTFKFCIPGEW